MQNKGPLKSQSLLITTLAYHDSPQSLFGLRKHELILDKLCSIS